ncbi:MAG: CopG family transcriptional regulator [Verrucomicrobia bacterium]|nr:CopG family transcriptional regulator [Verrucomicrobiota bacterium]
MSKTAKKISAPLTFDLPLSLIDKIQARQKSLGLATASEVVRLAMDQFDFERCIPPSEPHRQISVRMNPKQRATLKRHAKSKNTSVGELLRLAIDALPAKGSKR